MAKTFWVGRERCETNLDDTYDYLYYEAFAKEPKLRRDGQWTSKSNNYFLQDFCPEEFEEATGLKLKPGEIVQVKLTKVRGG
jgi:hypothetical protein